MKRIGVLLLALLVGACSPWGNVPDDLAFQGIRIDNGPLSNTRRWETAEITLSTNFNYTDYAINSDLLFIASVCFCDEKNTIVQRLDGYPLYERSVNNKWILINNPEAQTDLVGPPYIYHTFIHTFNHDSRPMYFKEKDITLLDFDLRQEPRDLCLRILGGTIGYHLQSNEVRIPKEELIKLFATTPRTLKD